MQDLRQFFEEVIEYAFEKLGFEEVIIDTEKETITFVKEKSDVNKTLDTYLYNN